METPDHLQCQLALTGEHLVDTIATGSVRAPRSLIRWPAALDRRKPQERRGRISRDAGIL